MYALAFSCRYGYLTNTKVKFILVTTDMDARDADVRNVSMLFSERYQWQSALVLLKWTHNFCSPPICLLFSISLFSAVMLLLLAFEPVHNISATELQISISNTSRDDVELSLIWWKSRQVFGEGHLVKSWQFCYQTKSVYSTFFNR